MALLRMHKDVYPPHGARDIETPDEPSARLRELVEREPAHTWAELESLNLRPEEFEEVPGRDYKLGFDNGRSISVHLLSRYAGSDRRYDWGNRPMLAERHFPEPVGAPGWFFALWKEWAEAERDAAAFVYGD